MKLLVFLKQKIGFSSISLTFSHAHAQTHSEPKRISVSDRNMTDASGVVPSVMKIESRGEGVSRCEAPDTEGGRIGNGNGSGSEEIVTLEDRDFFCPICLATIKDAFLTLCGHSFCYMCIITHLNSKNDCPCCGHYLTANQIFPNFLLEKVTHLSFLGLFILGIRLNMTFALKRYKIEYKHDQSNDVHHA